MRAWSILLLAGLLSGPLSAAQKFTYEDLVRRCASLEPLAVLPESDERCAQWSSYDRRSRYDEATGKYVDWQANDDGTGFIRQEGGQFVFAEMKGPGCIWRIWSAAPKEGHVKIFLDGAEQPAVDLPFIGYFDGTNEPFTRSALVHTVAKGWNNYTPIPYQKSCKILAEKGWGNYYHFVYATFPAGTRVPTFKRDLSPREKSALAEVNGILANCGSDPAGHRPFEVKTTKAVWARPGSTNRVLRLPGPCAITALRAKLELPPSPEDRTVLRELALRIRWDDEGTPSVWAPFGDFFGTAAGANRYRSLPLGLGEDGWWYCYWYMPCAHSAIIDLQNDGRVERVVQFEIVHAPIEGSIKKMGRFHAKWHRDAFLPAEPERAADWPLLKTQGKGRFCGVMLHVWHPRGGWWGEGDEKFFVDGEKFPSTFGTGSEDYFGYAWSDPTLFQNCYHNQTIAMRNKGHISVNRWQVTDNIPFQKSFEGDLEKEYPNSYPTLYASMAYWYLAPRGEDPYPPLPLSERVGYWSELPSTAVKGALEGERMKILGKTGGKTEEQGLDGFPGNWSDSSQLWWTGAKPGDKLDLALPVAKDGNYKVGVQLTKAGDYAIIQLYLDGEKLAAPIDLYNPEVIPSGLLDLGLRQLKAGEHKLTLEILGANPAALKAYMAGLDYVKLEPVP